MTIYYIFNEKNMIADYKVDFHSFSNYSYYPYDKGLYVNRMHNDLTKNVILFDIESITKGREKEIIKKEFNGYAKSFLDKVYEDFGITTDEIKEAIERGKNKGRQQSPHNRSFQLTSRQIIKRPTRTINNY